jgi:hypothetical protein
MLSISMARSRSSRIVPDSGTEAGLGGQRIRPDGRRCFPAPLLAGGFEFRGRGRGIGQGEMRLGEDRKRFASQFGDGGVVGHLIVLLWCGVRWPASFRFARCAGAWGFYYSRTVEGNRGRVEVRCMFKFKLLASRPAVPTLD